jgi:predicted metal-dependent phosphoesterase TrpH
MEKIALKTDIHMHTEFSPDSSTKLEDFLKRCMQRGLESVAVTDHNTIDGALALRDIAPIDIIVGEEIKSRDGDIIGLFLNKPIPGGLPALETVHIIKDQGGLVSIPHPFDHFRRLVIRKEALNLIVPYIDIIEGFNARNNLNQDNITAQQFAKKHGIITASVSDSHTLFEIGRTYMDLPDHDHTPAGFLDSLSNANAVCRKTTPLIHLLTTLTKTRNKLKGLLH